MTTGLRRLRQGMEDEAPIHYEGLPLRPAFRMGARVGSVVLIVSGIAGMSRGDGTLLEAVGAAAGAVGVVLLILSWRFRLYEIIATDRWLILRCGPLRHRLGREDVAVGPARPASSWRRLYSDREAALASEAHGRRLLFPVDGHTELRRLTGDGEAPR